MTSPRVIRGPKAKIFLYVCGVFVLTGLIACFNNALTQLDDLRKSYTICQQQEENLSTQLQVISDYKQSLEKSLKSEKAEHQQSKSNFEKQLAEEKSRNDLSLNGAKIKFNTLQQHYNLLQTQHDDFKAENKKNEDKKQEELSELKTKISQLQDEVKNINKAKEDLKSKYMEILLEKERLNKQLAGETNWKSDNESKLNHMIKTNNELLSDLENLKRHCPGQLPEYLPKKPEVSSSTQSNNNQPLQPGKNVLSLPGKDSKYSSSSTTKSQVSEGKLNGARPLLSPTVTPSPAKIPAGVVRVPAPAEEVIDNRYQIKLPQNNKKDHDELDKDNGANEVFDAPPQAPKEEVPYDAGLMYGAGEKDPIKDAESKNFNKQHINAMADNYHDLAANEGQLDENEGDDDLDGAYANLGQGKEGPAIRN